MRKSLPTLLYTTQWGEAHVGDSLDPLPLPPPESIDLVATSPPFGLQRKKEYGNETEDAHVEWLLRFAEPIRRVLKPTGSFVLDLGGAYRSGRPVRSLYNFRIMLRRSIEATRLLSRAWDQRADDEAESDVHPSRTPPEGLAD